MSCHDRIDIFEWIDIDKTSASMGFDMYHYWYLLNKECKFQTYVCNRCHDYLTISLKLSVIALSKI